MRSFVASIWQVVVIAAVRLAHYRARGSVV
jgi:hypothetical protein